MLIFTMETQGSEKEWISGIFCKSSDLLAPRDRTAEALTWGMESRFRIPFAKLAKAQLHLLAVHQQRQKSVIQ